jgi:signal transduction histidine kinase
LEQHGNLDGNWDADRITQVMCNLLSNAIRHGEQKTSITLSLIGAENDVTICVKNRGTIPPDVLPHVFDPFRSAEKTAQPQGLGLGLYIVEQIAIAHGGSVEAASDDENGTIFCVRLPRADLVVAS